MGYIRRTGCHLPVLTPLPAGMIAFSRWIGHYTLSVSGKVGYMSRNSFQESTLSRARSQRRSCRTSTRVYIREKTREALKGCPFRAGQQANLGIAGSPQRRFSSVWVG